MSALVRVPVDVWRIFWMIILTMGYPVHACAYSMCGFNVTLSQISVGVAYSVWSALGVLVVTTMGIVFFNEKCSPAKLVCLALIIGGVVGLNLLDNQ